MAAEGPQVHRKPGQSRAQAHRRQGRQGPAAELRHQHQRHGPGRRPIRRTSTRPSSATPSSSSRSCNGTKAKARTPKDDFYGGAGYDSKSRPDLSNTQMFLDALKAAGVPKDDPALQEGPGLRQPLPEPQGRVQRSALGQARSTTAASSTPRPPAASPRSSTSRCADGSLPGYGSMTYAGIKSMIYCGVAKDDPRVKKAYEWIQKNYTVDKNPGMPEAALAVGPVLLLPHHGQVPRRPGRGLRRRCQGRQARLAQGHHRGPGQTAAARRQLHQQRRPTGWKATPTSTPATL